MIDGRIIIYVIGLSIIAVAAYKEFKTYLAVRKRRRYY